MTVIKLQIIVVVASALLLHAFAEQAHCAHLLQNGVMVNKTVALASEEQERHSRGTMARVSLIWLMNATEDLYNRISVDVPYDSFLGEVSTFPERRPRTFNVLLATVKTVLADLVVQCVEQKTGRGGPLLIDWWRAAAFTLFGFFYEGLVSWFFYVTVFTRLFPDAIRFANSPLPVKFANRAGQWEVVGQVLLDNLVCMALIYFPVFYVIKEAVVNCHHLKGPAISRTEKQDAHQVVMEVPFLSQTFRSGLANYWQNIKADNMVSCAVWVPLDFIMFSIPMYLRMPFGHLASFAWTMLISHMRGAIH